MQENQKSHPIGEEKNTNLPNRDEVTQEDPEEDEIFDDNDDLEEEDLDTDEDSVSEDAAVEEDNTPVLDEEDLEENDLDEDEADDVEWEPEK